MGAAVTNDDQEVLDVAMAGDDGAAEGDVGSDCSGGNVNVGISGDGDTDGSGGGRSCGDSSVDGNVGGELPSDVSMGVEELKLPNFSCLVAEVEAEKERLTEARKRKRNRKQYEMLAQEIGKKRSKTQLKGLCAQDNAKVEASLKEANVWEEKCKHWRNQGKVVTAHIRMLLDSVRQTS